jgi:mono/diheme cytochrome c family protein
MKTPALIVLASLTFTVLQVQAETADRIARGEYLTRAADCVACHTDKGGEPFAGGLSFKTPMGTLYSTNITPDRETGIGTWSDEEFMRALREGKGKHGENLYPAMPYTSYTLITDEDVQLIKDYLFSLPPVRRRDQKDDMMFPFNVREGLSAWKLIDFDNRRFQPNDKMDDKWNTGAYLVEALGHCGECHTPRDISMGMKPSERYAGAMLEGWHAFNISSDKVAGIGDWSQDDIVNYLRSGNAAGKGQAAGPMAEVIENSTRHLTDADLQAMAYYLSTIEPKNPDKATRGRTTWGSIDQSVATLRGKSFQAANADGARLYLGNCASCHRYSGEGIGDGYYPSLINNSSVGAATTNNLIMVILNGVQRHTNEGEVFMPAFASTLIDQEIATLASHVLKQFGQPQLSIVAEDVKKLRHIADVELDDNKTASH